MPNNIPIPSFSSSAVRTRTRSSGRSTRSSSTRDHGKDNNNSSNTSSNSSTVSNRTRRGTASTSTRTSTGTSRKRKSPSSSGTQTGRKNARIPTSASASVNTDEKIQSPQHQQLPQANDENDTKGQVRSKSASTSTTNSSKSSHNYLSLLRKIDTVIELHIRRSHSKSRTPNMSISFSLDRLTNFVSQATDGNSYGGTTKSMTEDLVVVYIITASPDLIQVQYDNANASTNANAKMKITLPNIQSGGMSTGAGASTRTGTVKKQINRQEVLSNNYKTKWNGWDTEEVQILKTQIFQQRTLKELRDRIRNQESNGNGNGNSLLKNSNSNGGNDGSTEAILKPGMTLRERVLARSKAKDEQLQAILKKQEQLKSQSLDTGSMNGNSIHLIFADAVNLLFRHTAKRQRYHTKGKLNPNASLLKANSAPLSLRPIPLNEVCAHLGGGFGSTAKSVLSTSTSNSVGQIVGSGSGSGPGAGNRYSKKEIKKVLHELANIAPEWIQIVSGDTNSRKRSTKSRDRNNSGKKNLMVMLKSKASYQMVREKLSGRVIRPKPTSSIRRTSLKLVMTESHDSQEEDAKIPVDDAGMTTPKRKTTAKVKVDSPVDDDGNFSTAPSITSAVGRKRRSTTELVQMVKKQPHRSKLSTGKNRSRAAAPTKVSAPTMPPAMYEKETPPGNDHSEALGSTKSSSGGDELRVNYNQHMTDADYDGGLVLQSNSTNPRGLKRMLSQLNAGERI